MAHYVPYCFDKNKSSNSQYIMDEFMRIMGKHPVIKIDENFDSIWWYNKKIDISQLIKLDSYEISYVSGIFEEMLNTYQYYEFVGKPHPKEYGHRSSYKYSFCDSPLWWEDIETDKEHDFVIYNEVD